MYSVLLWTRPIVAAGDTEVSQTDKNPCPHGAYTLRCNIINEISKSKIYSNLIMLHTMEKYAAEKVDKERFGSRHLPPKIG